MVEDSDGNLWIGTEGLGQSSGLTGEHSDFASSPVLKVGWRLSVVPT